MGNVNRWGQIQGDPRRYREIWGDLGTRENTTGGLSRAPPHRHSVKEDMVSRKTRQRHSEKRPRRALRNVWAPWGASMRREHGHARARTFRSVSLPGVATEVRTYTQYSRAVATSVGAGVGVGAVVGAGTGTGGGAGAVPAEGGGGASAAEGVSSSRSNANHELLTEGNSTFTSPWESTRRTRPTVEWSTPSGQAHRGRCGHNKGGKWRTRVSEARARHEAREWMGGVHVNVRSADGSQLAYSPLARGVLVRRRRL